jgi:hypothetical protein
MIEIVSRLDKMLARIHEAGPALDVENAWVIAAQMGDIMVIASNGKGWDHVSVSLPYRCPLYDEMKAIKGIFFRDDEWAMELHAPPSKHISCHPYCLHLWRPQDAAIPIPPEEMV